MPLSIWSWLRNAGIVIEILEDSQLDVNITEIYASALEILFIMQGFIEIPLISLFDLLDGLLNLEFIIQNRILPSFIEDFKNGLTAWKKIRMVSNNMGKVKVLKERCNKGVIWEK